MAFRRGYPAELELVKLLRKRGFHAMRVPSAGAEVSPATCWQLRVGTGAPTR